MVNLKKIKKKIIIGTAQLSSNYGISNFTNYKFDKKKIYKFLDFCLSNNFLNFDTANGYSSEKIIGEFIEKRKIKKKIYITSKIPSLKKISKKKKIKFINMCLLKTSKNLKQNLNTMLFHDQNDIPFILNNFDQIKKSFKNLNITNIGFSIYDFKYIEIIKKKIKKDKIIIQVPINIINDEFLNKKYPKNFEIHGRSIFLQGFLINRHIKNNIKKRYLNLHKKYFLYLEKNLINPFQLCFEIIKSPVHKKLIIGFDSIDQIKNLPMKKKESLNNLRKHIREIKKIFKNTQIHDPRKWI